MTNDITTNQTARVAATYSIVAGIDWAINNIVFPIRLRRWYFFNISSKTNPCVPFPLDYSLRTHFIGAVIIRKHPVRVLVPMRLRERWRHEVAAALARNT
jgi:hypothetical protein